VKTSAGIMLRAILLVGAVGSLAIFQGPVDSADPSRTVPLVNPVGDRGAMGLFNKIVTSRGAEFDTGQAGLHMIRPVDATDIFPPTAPEIYVVVVLKQSAFDMFELIGRFIVEDPSGKPVGTLLHTDKAHFEFSDTGGYLLMRRPAGGFPVGNYRVEIHYGEEVNEISLMAVVRFKVASPAG
jgi:hypothetical protein